MIPVRGNVRYTPRMKRVVVAIGGSDSSGGAGIQADVRTLSACGVWPATVVTAVTAQDETGVRASLPVDPDGVRSQLRTIFTGRDDVTAVKTGMLANAAIVREVAAALRDVGPPLVVCDPVLRSGDGKSLLEEDAFDVLRRELLPHVSVLTPNVPEAERLTGEAIRTVEDVIRSARRLLESGPDAVLVTGGHLDASPGTDVLVTGGEVHVYDDDEWLEGGRVHGTGCVTSAALAASLAKGDMLPEAVRYARTFVRQAIRAAYTAPSGLRSADPAFAPSGSVLEGS